VQKFSFRALTHIDHLQFTASKSYFFRQTEKISFSR